MRGLDLTQYMGVDVKDLLRVAPFSGWSVNRSREPDLPEEEIWYEFEGHGVEVTCDADDRIRTIFLHRGGGETLIDLPFSFTRQQVLRRYGTPSKSGARSRMPVLGERGPWDRFALPAASLHVEYGFNRDEVELVTLMRYDVVP